MRPSIRVLLPLLLLSCGSSTPKAGPGLGDSCVAAACADGLVCSHEGVCAAAGELGTRLSGDDCSATEECTYTLVCSSTHVCVEAGSTGTGGAGAACGGDADCQSGFACQDAACEDLGVPLWEGGPCPADDTSFYAIFEPPRLPVSGQIDFFALPYPNDYRLDVYGHPDLSGFPTPGAAAPTVDALLASLEDRIDGFGVNPSVFFRFSQPVDSDTVFGLADGATVHFASLDPDADDYGELNAMAWSTRSTRGRYICGNQVIVSVYDGEPLLGSHTYAVWLTDGITNRSGEPAGRTAALEEVLGPDMPAGLANGQIWEDYEPLRAYLTAKGLGTDDIVSAAVFSTGNAPTRTRALADGIAAPTLDALTSCEDGVSPCDDGGERVCATHEGMIELHATLAVPSYTDTDGKARWDLAAARPLAEGTEDVCVVLTVPTGAPPPEGWPVVIHGGDVGGTFRDAVAVGLAEALASSGVATLGIELPGHGARGRSGDAFADFYAFTDPEAWLGSYVQQIADLHALESVATGWSLDTMASPTGSAIAFDADNLWFVGSGQGGSAGASYLAWSRDAQGGALANPAGWFAVQVTEQTSPIDLAHGLQIALADADLPHRHPLVTLLQNLFDTVDPTVFADGVLREPFVEARHVYLAYGVEDDELPSRTIQSLDLAFGLPTGGDVLIDYGQGHENLPVSANITTDDGEVTGATRQLWGGHDVLEEGALDSVVGFVVSGVTGVPEVGE